MLIDLSMHCKFTNGFQINPTQLLIATIEKLSYLLKQISSLRHSGSTGRVIKTAWWIANQERILELLGLSFHGPTHKSGDSNRLHVVGWGFWIPWGGERLLCINHRWWLVNYGDPRILWRWRRVARGYQSQVGFCQFVLKCTTSIVIWNLSTSYIEVQVRTCIWKCMYFHWHGKVVNRV